MTSMGRPRVAIVVVMSVVCATLTLDAPALASHGDSGAEQLQLNPDNKDQEYEKINMQTGGEIACNTGQIELEKTQITTSEGSSDIHCKDAYYDASWFGLTTCTDKNWWNDRCDHYDVEFDLSDEDVTPDTSAETNAWIFVGCHEFGHTGGLGHRPVSGRYASCMEAGSGHPDFNQHDIDEINEDV